MKKDLSNKQIERMLKDAVTHITPDNKEEVISKCKNAKESTTIVFPGSRIKKRLRIYQLVSAVAIILFAINLALLFGSRTKLETVAAVIDIDVNPSIELSINENDRVIKAEAINEDAMEILDGMDLTGTQTKVAINAIMGSMLEHGYLQGETKYVLVSVDSKTKDNAKELETKVTEDIDSILSTYSVDAQVISQSMYEDEEVITMADDYGISQGKAALIRRIMALDSSYYEDELSLMSISELDALLTNLEEKVNITPSTEVIVVSANDNTDKDKKDSDKDKDTGIKETVSENSVSKNSVSENSISENSVSENSVSENSVSKNSISKNSVSKNEVNKENKENN